QIQTASAALIADAVAAAQRGLVVTEPRHSPAETDSRRNIVPVVFVELFVRMRRIGSDQLQRRQVALLRSQIPKIRTAATGPAEARQAASHDGRSQSVFDVGNAVIIPPHAEVQSERWQNLVVILEEQIELGLVDLADLVITVCFCIAAEISPCGVVQNESLRN